MAAVTPSNMDKGFLCIGRSLTVNSKRFPNKIALQELERKVTYREFNQKVNQLCHGLKGLGLRKGDHVAILMGNKIEHMIVLYAAAKIGAVAVVLDVKWISREIGQALDFFNCNLLIYDAIYQSKLPSDLDHLNFGAFAGAGGAATAPSIDDLMKDSVSDEPDERVQDENLFMIMLTGGTTGTPKGCLVNHKTYAVHCQTSAVTRGVDENSKELVVVPIYYNSGRATAIAHLYFGGTLYLRDRFDPRETLEIVQNEKITSLALASTMVHRILEIPDLDSYRTDSIKALRKAGLPFTRSMVEGLVKHVTPNLFQSYASTDAGQVTLLKPHEQLTKIGSSGRPIWGVEVEVVDDSSDPLPAGHDGEIRVRGPNVCQGYYKNPDENARSFRDGWYYTGDLGRFDPDGYLYVVGRKKDIIKTGSINVAPREVENILLNHPQIDDAAVFGVPDPEWGEVIKALVVRKFGSTVREDTLRAYCKENLAGYKVPKVIEFVSQLPRNSLGKVTLQALPAQKEDSDR
jgi:acyl-CoA synthetase (AMP-forming)/AMP-acid ligase II